MRLPDLWAARCRRPAGKYGSGRQRFLYASLAGGTDRGTAKLQVAVLSHRETWLGGGGGSVGFDTGYAATLFQAAKPRNHL